MKKSLKIVLLMLVLVISINATVLAKASGISPKDYTGGGASVSSITTTGNKIIQIVSTIGSIASVIVLVVLGLKYMMGSAEEKAEYKKTLLPYIIGAALVFAASTIASVVFNFASSI